MDFFLFQSSPTVDEPVQAAKASPSPPLSSKLWAHQRFAHLVEPDAKTPSATQTISDVIPGSETDPTQTQPAITPDLPLPHDFRVLLELFRSCDTVVSMLHNRSEVCSFDKLKPAVQEVVRR